MINMKVETVLCIAQIFSYWCHGANFSCNRDDVVANYSVFCMKLHMHHYIKFLTNRPRYDNGQQDYLNI